MLTRVRLGVILLIVSVSRKSKEIFKSRPYCTKKRKFWYPRGVYSGHPVNFQFTLPRLLIFYKPSWAIIFETKMTIIIYLMGQKNFYDNTHDYAEYRDFYYDSQNLHSFSNFWHFLRFFQSCSFILKTKIFGF